MKTASLLRAVDQAMAVRNAGLPGCGVAGLEHGLAVVLAQHHFAFEHVDKLVFVFVPVALRGGRARLERADVDAEMCRGRRRAPSRLRERPSTALLNGGG